MEDSTTPLLYSIEDLDPGMDLFGILENTNRTDTDKKFLRECRIVIPFVEIKFDADGKDRVIVNFKNRIFVFEMQVTKESTKYGKIEPHEDSPLVATYFYPKCQNGTRMLIHRITLLFVNPAHREMNLHLQFRDPNRSIVEILEELKMVNQTTKMFINKPRVTKDELEYLNTHYSHLEVMIFRSDAPDELEGFALNFKRVGVNNTIQLCAEHLNQMRCEHLHLRNGNINGSELNKFIRSWRAANDLPNLRSIWVQNYEESPDLYKGLHFPEGKSTRRGRKYKFYHNMYWDCFKAIDIKRNDGTCGTIVRWKDEFAFLVWKEMFHEIPDGYTVANPEEDPEQTTNELSRSGQGASMVKEEITFNFFKK